MLLFCVVFPESECVICVGVLILCDCRDRVLCDCVCLFVQDLHCDCVCVFVCDCVCDCVCLFVDLGV